MCWTAEKNSTKTDTNICTSSATHWVGFQSEGDICELLTADISVAGVAVSVRQWKLRSQRWVTVVVLHTPSEGHPSYTRALQQQQRRQILLPTTVTTYTYLALRSSSSLWNNGQQVSPAHTVGCHCLFLAPADSSRL